MPRPLRKGKRGPRVLTVVDSDRKKILRDLGFTSYAPRFTKSEWVFLELLYRNLDKEVSLNTIVSELFFPDKWYVYEVDKPAVFSLVQSIRSKIGDEHYQPKWLVSIRGERGRAVAFKLIPRRRNKRSKQT